MKWLSNIVQKILQITHGRTTAFFLAFFVAGHAMALVGKLSQVYVAYMIGLGGLVLAHSTKDDLAVKWNGARPPSGPDPMPAAPAAPGGDDDVKS